MAIISFLSLPFLFLLFSFFPMLVSLSCLNAPSSPSLFLPLLRPVLALATGTHARAWACSDLVLPMQQWPTLAPCRLCCPAPKLCITPSTPSATRVQRELGATCRCGSGFSARLPSHSLCRPRGKSALAMLGPTEVVLNGDKPLFSSSSRIHSKWERNFRGF